MNAPSLNRDSVLLTSANVSIAFIGLFAQLVVIHTLEVKEYGYWIILLDAFLTIATLVDFGISDVLIREWSGKLEEIRSLTHSGWSSQLLISLIIVFFVSIGLFSFGKELDYPAPMYMAVIIGSCITFQMSSFKIGLRMIGEAKFESILLVIDKTLSLIGFTAVLYLDGGIELLCYSFLIMSLVSQIITYSVFLIILRRTGSDNSIQHKIVFRKMLRKGLPFSITLFIIPLFGRIDKFVISYYSDLDSVAIFNIPWLIILAGLAVPRSIRQGSITMFGNAKQKGKPLTGIIKESGMIVSSLVVIGAPLCLLVSSWAFVFFFPVELISPETHDYSGLRILSILLSSWIWAMLGCVELESLKIGERPFQYTAVSLFGILLNLVASIILIKNYGLLGASLSSVITFFGIFFASSITSNTTRDFPELFYRKLIFGSLSTIILISTSVLGNINSHPTLLMVCLMIVCSGIICLHKEVYPKLTKSFFGSRPSFGEGNGN